MSGFWTDLNRELEEYEDAEREAAYWEAVDPNWRELATDPEDRDLIPEGDVLDPPVNLARTA